MGSGAASLKQGILTGCAVLALGMAAAGAAAQTLVIANARIIDGTGKVIEHGAVVAKDGKVIADRRRK